MSPEQERIKAVALALYGADKNQMAEPSFYTRMAKEATAVADATRPASTDLVKAARELFEKWLENPRAVGDADWIDLHAALKDLP